MNYDQRILFLKQWFKTDILTRFNMPRDLDPKIVATDIIEAVNRNIASQTTQEQMGHIVVSITKDVTQSARTRTLPSVKEFIDATRNTAQSHGEPRSVGSKDFLDPTHINAQRVRSGEAVSEYYITGRGRQKLIDYGVSEADLKKYEVAPAAHMQ